MRLRGAFTALLLLVGGGSAVIVLPPTNLMVSCQNLRVTASWEYEEQPPPTSFIVYHRSSSSPTSDFTTSDHHVNLSRMVLGSELDLLAFHSVEVVAVRGGNRSKPAQFPTFTFNKLKPADMKCAIDFPPVDLSLQDLEGTVTFMNPLHFYRDLKRAVDLTAASVSFTASISNDAEFSGFCYGREKNCKVDILFPHGVETCVTLTGLLFMDNDGAPQVSLRETERICDVKPAVDHVILLAVLLSVLLLIIIVMVLVICKVKAWLEKPKPIPRSLLLPDGRAGVSLIDANDNGSSNCWLEADLPYSCKNSSASEVVPSPDSTQLDRGGETEDDSADDSMGTYSFDINSREEDEEEEEEEDTSGGYDRPHFQVDIGDGEVVEAYGK